MTFYFIDAGGVILGASSESTPEPSGTVTVIDDTVSPAPVSGKQVWDGSSWGDVPKPTKLSFDDFESRFTAGEWDAATDFVYESDTSTGKPKRRALVQGLARAQSRNMVDLFDAKTDAFLAALVSGGVLTSERKAVILAP